MKAVLVIDMPTWCGDCPCEDGEIGECNIAHVSCDYLKHERPSWCPLKSLPQRKSGDDLYERYGSWTPSDEKEVYYRVGFNDCLDEITGETE